MQGLEVLPRKRFDYRGQILEEFDIDAALARHPSLLVVDELAHTNAPDSRHPKRWQDVKELLDAGIDVWTALNIQHLESLADVVAQITGVTVRETVPDSILQTAQDVVLVDITPDELIARLKAGKIYLPQTAQRATENFFTPGNLTALRELALRRTADRVEDQMTQILRQKAIEGPWGTTERLLVCVGADDTGERLVRQAARLASSLNAALDRGDADAPRPSRRSCAGPPDFGRAGLGNQPWCRGAAADQRQFHPGHTAHRPQGKRHPDRPGAPAIRGVYPSVCPLFAR